MVYETHSLLGRPVRAGRVVAAEFVNQGKSYRAVRYGASYYTPEGNNLRKAFLRAPLEFSRISSGFGRRVHPMFRTWRAHKGGYAAPAGTRVRAVGDGVVEFAGEGGGYGKMVIVRHHGSYSTVYAHLSRFASGVRRGARLAQNDSVGYVGQTGWATGPHLHYEFRIAGEARNPHSIAMPAGRPVAAAGTAGLSRPGRASRRAARFARQPQHLRAPGVSEALFVGLMSGTSLDGVDAVLADLAAPAPRILAAAHQPFDAALRAGLQALGVPGQDELERAALLGNELAHRYASAIAELLLKSGKQAAEVRAAGCHGQTVRHHPERGYSLQIGNAALLAELSGVAVVADFRSRDVAAAPWRAVVRHSRRGIRAPLGNRVVVNTSALEAPPCPGNRYPASTAARNCRSACGLKTFGTPLTLRAWAAGGIVGPQLLQRPAAGSVHRGGRRLRAPEALFTKAGCPRASGR